MRLIIHRTEKRPPPPPPRPQRRQRQTTTQRKQQQLQHQQQRRGSTRTTTTSRSRSICCSSSSRYTTGEVAGILCLCYLCCFIGFTIFHKYYYYYNGYYYLVEKHDDTKSSTTSSSSWFLPSSSSSSSSMMIQMMSKINNNQIITTKNVQQQQQHNNNNNKRQRRPIRFIWGIFTMDSESEFQRRQVIRDTYLSLYKNNQTTTPNRICSLLQLLRDYNNKSSSVVESEIILLQQQQKQKQKQKYYYDCQLAYVFVQGGNPNGPTELCNDNLINSSYPLVLDRPVTVMTNQSVVVEDDVLYLNIKENMKQGKSQTWFKYASTIIKNQLHNHNRHQQSSLSSSSSSQENLLPIEFDYISKVDSDTIVYPSRLFDFASGNANANGKQNNNNILQLPLFPNNSLTYGGFPVDMDTCGGSWDKDCSKSISKIYMGGGFYFMSIDLAEYISSNYINRTSLAVLHEDLSIGNFVFSHPLSNEQIRTVTIPPNLHIFEHRKTLQDVTLYQRKWDWFQHEYQSGIIIPKFYFIHTSTTVSKIGREIEFQLVIACQGKPSKGGRHSCFTRKRKTECLLSQNTIGGMTTRLHSYLKLDNIYDATTFLIPISGNVIERIQEWYEHEKNILLLEQQQQQQQNGISNENKNKNNNENYDANEEYDTILWRKRFFQDCFPTLDSLGLIFYNNNNNNAVIIKEEQPTTTTKDCIQEAYKLRNFSTSSLYYNYQYYYNNTIPLHPNMDVYVIRDEYYQVDIRKIEEHIISLLPSKEKERRFKDNNTEKGKGGGKGGGGAVAAAQQQQQQQQQQHDNNNNIVQNNDVLLSMNGAKGLCCGLLQDEIQIYIEFIRLASNLDEFNRKESIKSLFLHCHFLDDDGDGIDGNDNNDNNDDIYSPIMALKKLESVCKQ